MGVYAKAIMATAGLLGTWLVAFGVLDDETAQQFSAALGNVITVALVYFVPNRSA